MSRLPSLGLHLDRSLLVVLSQRAWQGLGGVVTIWFIATHLSIVDQGWYYAFLGLAAFASFFDLGMSIVILQTSARVTALYKVGRSRLGADSLYGHFRPFYLKVVLAFVLFGLLAGWLVFSTPAAAEGRSWFAPWGLLVVVTAGNLWSVPALAIWEGSGAVEPVYLLRLLQGVAGSILTWIALAFFDPLWAATVAPSVSFLLVAAYIWNRRLNLVQEQELVGEIEGLSALKWRVAVSWIAGYCLIQISPPLLLRLGLVEDSGRMGLSLAIVNMIGILALSVITTLVPKMSELAEGGDHKALNDLFKRAFIMSSVFYVMLSTVVMTLLVVGKSSGYAARILPLETFIFLLAASFCSHMIGCLAAYLRSYFLEPYAFLFFLLAIISLLALFLLSPRFGVTGYTAFFAALQILLGLPSAVVIFLQHKKALQK